MSRYATLGALGGLGKGIADVTIIQMKQSHEERMEQLRSENRQGEIKLDDELATERMKTKGGMDDARQISADAAAMSRVQAQGETNRAVQTMRNEADSPAMRDARVLASEPGGPSLVDQYNDRQTAEMARASGKGGSNKRSREPIKTLVPDEVGGYTEDTIGYVEFADGEGQYFTKFGQKMPPPGPAGPEREIMLRQFVDAGNEADSQMKVRQFYEHYGYLPEFARGLLTSAPAAPVTQSAPPVAQQSPGMPPDPSGPR